MDKAERREMNEDRFLSSLRRRRPLLAVAAALALALTLLWAVSSYAGVAGDWHATDFQVQNLSTVPAEITARFHHPDGSVAYTFTDTIRPGCNEYYQPEQMVPAPLDPAFSGTLRIETDKDIASGIMHFATTEPGYNGNDVFETVADDVMAREYFAPYVERDLNAFSSEILVGNLGTAMAMATVTIYAPGGAQVLSPTHLSIPVNGRASLDLRDVVDLGSPFIGSAAISATEPIWVDVVGTSWTQWATYAAPSAGSPALHAPYVEGYQAGIVMPSIYVQNVSLASTTVTVCRVGGACDSSSLQPKGSHEFVLTDPLPGSYTITGTERIAAVVGTEGSAGASAYTALRPDQASFYEYAPLLFDDFGGLTTTLWVYNPGTITATVAVTFTGTPTPVIGYTAKQIRPGEVFAFLPGGGIPSHHAAQVVADEPVLALIVGTILGAEDGSFAYRATGSTSLAPPCLPRPIPTLTEWGYVVLAIFMVLVAVWTLRRRSHVASVG
jgi:hypothetical protein